MSIDTDLLARSLSLEYHAENDIQIDKSGVSWLATLSE